MDSLVDGVLDWSPLARIDLPGVVELREAIDYIDDAPEVIDLDHLTRRFDEALGDPANDAVVGRDVGGTIVAYAWNVVRRPAGSLPQVWLDGGVHPGWRHQGIGSHMVAWQLARAEEWLRDARAREPDLDTVWVGTYVDERVPARSQVMSEAGLAPEHWFLDMQAPISPDDRTDLPVVLTTRHGPVRIEPFTDDRSDETRLLHNEVIVGPRARSDGHSDAPATIEQWQQFLRRPSGRPQWSWIAVSGGHVVGYVLNSIDLNSIDTADVHGHRAGWTDRLGVAFSWRGLGIATALLRASHHSFAGAGLDTAGVSVETDDPDRDLGAFRASGYHSDDTVGLYSRLLRLDADWAAHWEAPGRLG